MREESGNWRLCSIDQYRYRIKILDFPNAKSDHIDKYIDTLHTQDCKVEDAVVVTENKLVLLLKQKEKCTIRIPEFLFTSQRKTLKDKIKEIIRWRK